MNDLPVQSDDNLPTLKGWIENLLGFHLPSIPLPQTLKNTDKALGVIVTSLGNNVAERIGNNTKMLKLRGKEDRNSFAQTSEEVRKLKNRADIFKMAVDNLEQHPGSHDAPGEIEDDWLNLFARLAEDKSSDELKSLFAKILSGELRKPGAVSLRTLQFVSTLSRADAEAIAKFLSYSLQQSFVARFVDETGYPSLEVQTQMFELGIVSEGANEIGGLVTSYQIVPTAQLRLLGSRYAIAVLNSSTERVDVEIGGQMLTSTGRQLLGIADLAPTNSNYLEKVARHILAAFENRPSGKLSCDVNICEIITDNGVPTGLRKMKKISS